MHLILINVFSFMIDLVIFIFFDLFIYQNLKRKNEVYFLYLYSVSNKSFFLQKSDLFSISVQF